MAAARHFIGRVLGIAVHQLTLDADVELTDEEIAIVLPLLERLASGEPLAYVEGSVGFYKHEFIIDQRALIPRADSEVVVELCLESIQGIKTPRLLDVGVGSGCLILSLLAELPDASGVAVDIEAGVLELAALNASALALENRLCLIESDCLSALSEDQQFDLIVSNPPYVTHDEELGPSVVEFEPHRALFVTDGDAMQFYKRIMLEAKQHLAPSGIIVFEIGANRQDDLACAATECGYRIIEQRQDMCAIVRALSLKLIS